MQSSSLPSKSLNITSRDIPAAGLPPNWWFTIRAAHCNPRNTLKYEQDDVRVAIQLALRHRLDHGAGLFVDVGSNCGLYSLIMASLGHRCIAADPLPTCVQDTRGSAADNYFQPSRLAVFHSGVSDAYFTFRVPTHMCSPYFEVGSTSEVRRRVGSWSDTDHATTTHARAAPLTEVLRWASENGSDIMMLKIDTEGHEVRVLASAIPLFKRGTINVVLWELTPSKWAQANVSRAFGLETLSSIFSQRHYYSFFSGRASFCDHHKKVAACQHVRSTSFTLPRGAVYIPDVGELADAMLATKWEPAENIFSLRVRGPSAQVDGRFTAAIKSANRGVGRGARPRPAKLRAGG